MRDSFEIELDAAIGGKYEMPDGRNFWIDGAVSREIVRRIMPVFERLKDSQIEDPSE